MAMIYIVEDDDSIREIEEFALLNAGHQVVGCSCAKDFYGELEKEIPDLCLLDIMLPDGGILFFKHRKQGREN